MFFGIKIKGKNYKLFMFAFHNKKIYFAGALVVVFLLVFGIGFFVGQKQIVSPIYPPENVDLSLFWDAYYKLQKNFIEPTKLDTQKIIY